MFYLQSEKMIIVGTNIEAQQHSVEKQTEFEKLYEEDIERLKEILGKNFEESHEDEITRSLDYPLKLVHFKKAIEANRDATTKEVQKMIQETVRLKQQPMIGHSYGLVALRPTRAKSDFEGGQSLIMTRFDC